MISDALLLQYLLEATKSYIDPIVWRDTESGTLTAAINGVALELQTVATRAGSQIYLRLARQDYEIFVAEPPQTSFFAPKDADHKTVSTNLRDLWKLAQKQVAQRKAQAAENRDRIRQNLFRQVIFGEADSSRNYRTEFQAADQIAS
ncbi:MAG TPA: hypothetical protein VEQ63_04045 [Bryobacteraceae bacterium]|nr:hypothetical protein [Bryobacteraceae bacterium]